MGIACSVASPVGYDVWRGENGNTGGVVTGVVVMWFECMGEGVAGDSVGGGVGATEVARAGGKTMWPVFFYDAEKIVHMPPEVGTLFQ